MNELLGLHMQPKDLGFAQVAVRAVIVFFGALIIVRVADRRFMGKMSAFDVILGFVLASMLARAINGSAPFWPTLVGGIVLALLHRIIGVLAFHSDWLGRLVKGEARVLIEKGQPRTELMRAFSISEKDLLEELRLHGNLDRLDKVERATMERSGKISVVPTEKA